MEIFFVRNNASRLSLRMFTQASDGEICNGDVIDFADTESVSPEFAQDLLLMIRGKNITMINQSQNIKAIFEVAKKKNSEEKKHGIDL